MLATTHHPSLERACATGPLTAPQDESCFWRAFFGLAHATIIEGIRPADVNAKAAKPVATITGDAAAAEHPDAAAEAKTALEKVAAAIEFVPNVPAPLPAAERRFQAADILQSSGVLSREQLFTFFTSAKLMIEEPATHKLLFASAGAVKELGDRLLVWQLELLESLGVEREWGTVQMQPTTVVARFPMDKELQEAMQGFVSSCGRVCWATALELRRRALSDVTGRQFSPAQEVQHEVRQPSLSLGTVATQPAQSHFL